MAATSFAILTESGKNPFVLSTIIHSFPTIVEDSAPGVGITVAHMVGGSFFDADAGTQKGVALTGSTGNGRWQYSLDGLTWNDLGVVSNSHALLITLAQRLRFVPASDWNGTATVSFVAWDRTIGIAGDRADATDATQNAFSSVEEFASVLVTPVNDRPVLATGGTPTLPALPLGAANPAGTSVASLLGTAVTDVDSPSFGIAVTSLTGTGIWQYSLDAGATWLGVGPVSTVRGLLLRDTSLLRFVPAAGFKGTAVVKYRAWDRSTGTEGTKVNPTVGTAFSLAFERTYVGVGNTAPTLNAAGNPVLPTIPEDSAAGRSITVRRMVAGAIADVDSPTFGIAVTGLTGSGNWQYSLNGGVTWLGVGTVSPARSNV